MFVLVFELFFNDNKSNSKKAENRIIFSIKFRLKFFWSLINLFQNQTNLAVQPGNGKHFAMLPSQPTTQKQWSPHSLGGGVVVITGVVVSTFSNNVKIIM